MRWRASPKRLGLRTLDVCRPARRLEGPGDRGLHPSLGEAAGPAHRATVLLESSQGHRGRCSQRLKSVPGSREVPNHHGASHLHRGASPPDHRTLLDGPSTIRATFGVTDTESLIHSSPRGRPGTLTQLGGGPRARLALVRPARIPADDRRGHLFSDREPRSAPLSVWLCSRPRPRSPDLSDRVAGYWLPAASRDRFYIGSSRRTPVRGSRARATRPSGGRFMAIFDVPGRGSWGTGFHFSLPSTSSSGHGSRRNARASKPVALRVRPCLCFLFCFSRRGRWGFAMFSHARLNGRRAPVSDGRRGLSGPPLFAPRRIFPGR